MQIPDHSYRVLIIGGLGSGKTNSLFNLLNHQANIDKIYLHAKDQYEEKYQLLFNLKFNLLPKNFIFNKLLILNFHVLKYGLLMKILNFWR